MFIATLIIGVLLGLFMGNGSNGMTSPRTAFNLYTAPTCAVICAVIGAVVGLFTGAFVATAVTGLFGGLIGGFVGLCIARFQRGGF